MAVPSQELVTQLRVAHSEGNWQDVASILRQWADENTDDPAARAAGVVAACLSDEDTDPDYISATLEGYDQRLLNMVELLRDLRAGRTQKARQRAVEEVASGGGQAGWLGVLGMLDPDNGEPARHLFGTPHLVSGCVMENHEVVSMATKGSRMSVDSLAFQANAVLDGFDSLSRRIDIGTVRNIVVVAEDGGWVLASDGGEPSRIASALVAASPMTGYADARAQNAVQSGAD